MAVKELSPRELRQMMDEGTDFQLIDVREPHERQIAQIGGELIPVGQIVQASDKLRRDVPVVIYCRSGGRSERAVLQLQASGGFTNLYNMAGGILRWIDDVDPTLKRY